MLFLLALKRNLKEKWLVSVKTEPTILPQNLLKGATIHFYSLMNHIFQTLLFNTRECNI